MGTLKIKNKTTTMMIFSSLVNLWPLLFQAKKNIFIGKSRSSLSTLVLLFCRWGMGEAIGALNIDKSKSISWVLKAGGALGAGLQFCPCFVVAWRAQLLSTHQDKREGRPQGIHLKIVLYRLGVMKLIWGGFCWNWYRWVLLVQLSNVLWGKERRGLGGFVGFGFIWFLRNTDV